MANSRQMDFLASLPDWEKQTVVAAIVAAVVTMILGGCQSMIFWLIKRHRDTIDRKVLNYLKELGSGVTATVEKVSGETQIKKEKAEASLERLSDRNQVTWKKKGQWHAVRHSVEN